MPSAPDKDRPDSCSCKSSHPLTAFTRFIDDQISSVLQSTIGLPSSKEDVQTWQWWKDLENGNHKNQSSSTQREHGKSQQSTPDWVLSSPDPPNFSSQSQTINSVLSDLNLALHQLQTTSLPTLSSDMGPSVNAICGSREAWQDLKNYLNNSSYSPIKLENDPKLENSSIFWRSAFVDLVYEAQGKSCSTRDFSREYLDKPDISIGFWKDDFLETFHKQDLQLRTKLESSIAFTVSARLNKLTKSAQEIVNRFHPSIPDNSSSNCDGCSKQENSQPSNNNQLSNNNQPSNENRWTEQDFQDMKDRLDKDETQSPTLYKGRTVTEQMTFVKETVLPDGTVKRRRVLRTGFSDGTSNTQTSNEVINSTKPAEARASDAIAVTPNLNIEEAKASTEVKKGGWFWK